MVEEKKKQNASEKESCPSFGRHWDPKDSTCQACSGVYPEEYDECKRLTIAEQEARKANPPSSKEEEPEEVESEEEEPEEPEEPEEQVVPKASVRSKTKIDKGLTEGLTIQQYVMKLIKEGRQEAEVKESLKNVYLQAGRNEKFAKSRANAIFNWALKQAK